MNEVNVKWKEKPVIYGKSGGLGVIKYSSKQGKVEITTIIIGTRKES